MFVSRRFAVPLRTSLIGWWSSAPSACPLSPARHVRVSRLLLGYPIGKRTVRGVEFIPTGMRIWNIRGRQLHVRNMENAP